MGIVINNQWNMHEAKHQRYNTLDSYTYMYNKYCSIKKSGTLPMFSDSSGKMYANQATSTLSYQ